jgi:hypothetical protein
MQHVDAVNRGDRMSVLNRLGWLLRGASADLLGLGSWECGVRLSLRGLARPDWRVGQSVGPRGTLVFVAVLADPPDRWA